MKKINEKRRPENRPRLTVFRSNKTIYAQIINDEEGRTLVAASEKDTKPANTQATKTVRAQQVGEILAKKALKKGITKVVFDRHHYRYHGRVKALAEGARKEGLQF